MAALLAERDPLPRGAPVDLSLRLEAVTHPRRYAERHPHPANRPPSGIHVGVASLPADEFLTG